MGQHRLFYVDPNIADGVVNRSINNKPNQEHPKLVPHKIRCLVCQEPSARFKAGTGVLGSLTSPLA